jgi:hypothetical protein
MDIDQIRTERHELEQQAGELLGKMIKEFEEKTGVTVEDVKVSIDTVGTISILQHQQAPLKVIITIEAI